MGSRYEVHFSPMGGTSTPPQARALSSPQFSSSELTAASKLAGVDVNTLTPAERLAWVEVVRAQLAAST